MGIATFVVGDGSELRAQGSYTATMGMLGMAVGCSCTCADTPSHVMWRTVPSAKRMSLVPLALCTSVCPPGKWYTSTPSVCVVCQVSTCRGSDTQPPHSLSAFGSAVCGVMETAEKVYDTLSTSTSSHSPHHVSPVSSYLWWS
jgi:hypothetical protein